MTTFGKGWRTVAAAAVIGVFGVVHALNPEVKLPSGEVVDKGLDAFELILSLITPVVMVVMRIFSNTKIGTKDVPQTPPPLPNQVIRTPVALAVFALVLATIAMLSVPAAYAQTAPSLTFTASAKSGSGKLDTVLTWAATPATATCVASGTPATWAGAKPASGSFTLPTITASGSYSPTLTCTWAADNTIQFDWAPPTKNTDGTTLTDLSSINLYWGKGTDVSLLTTKQVLGPAVATWKSGPLAAGVWSGFLTSTTTNGAESDNSAVASKTIQVALPAVSESIPLTVGTKPNAPTNVTAQ